MLANTKKLCIALWQNIVRLREKIVVDAVKTAATSSNILRAAPEKPMWLCI